MVSIGKSNENIFLDGQLQIYRIASKTPELMGIRMPSEYGSLQRLHSKCPSEIWMQSGVTLPQL